MEHGQNTDGKAKDNISETPRTEKTQSETLLRKEEQALGCLPDPCSVRVSSVAPNSGHGQFERLQTKMVNF
jgi:hypothetical protein